MMQRVWGRHQFQRGRFVEAEAAFKKAIALDPKSSDAQLNLAENYLFGLKKAKPAEAAYRAAIALDAGSAQAHLGLAATLGVLGQPDAALAEYEQAAKLAPADPKFTHALARFQAVIAFAASQVAAIAIAQHRIAGRIAQDREPGEQGNPDPKQRGLE